MQVKIIEIRDRATFIAALCIDMNPDTIGSMYKEERLNPIQRYYLRRYGYPCDGRPNIMITHAAGNGFSSTTDPYSLTGRTWPTAHNYIIEHWNALHDGDVVDVEYILGESKKVKVSERLNTVEVK